MKWIKRTLLIVAVIALTLSGVRAFDSQRGPPLELWHTYVPHEPVADDIDPRTLVERILHAARALRH